MGLLGYIVIGLYLFCLSYITIYCLFQFHLLLHYTKHKRAEKKSEIIVPEMNGEWPSVTIQLPIFNEYFVVERLIDNIASLDYPKDKFEIHILDDSTDETIELSKKKAAEYRAKGFNIQCITREERKGYKAGALKDAMAFAKGEFIAIFDADFLPNPTFLKDTVPYFNDDKVGVVQTRWGHINQGYSLITELQAFQLNVHFTVEQQGRESADYLLQFNGTAGVWRRQTIEDAGGWEADTLTEDLDLSYRAQLKGWKINYLEEVLSPAELPAEMIGLKSQQFRWMKGGAETAKKLLPTIWKSKLNLMKKIHASIHLMGSTIFLFVFFMGVLSVPLLSVINPLNLNTDILSIFLISLVAIIAVYYVANVNTAWDNQNKLKSFIKFIFIFPCFLALSMGLSFHNSLAVLQGYRGKKSSFVRTPKFNIKGITDSLNTTKYRGSKISMVTILEGILALYFLLGIGLGIKLGDNSLILFHALLCFGYGTIFYYSVKHLRYQT
ncbi:MAG: glycosyltransferase [Saprospiraceae bacterium]|nr:glycosyltransferase family 2 protein [Bacteroidia bacterium]NNE16324.1 glycosyltransferase [Saprospiraceae bacterium]NNL93942.1 glycosyltransferase [Saprospiraceae bacterium]